VRVLSHAESDGPPAPIKEYLPHRAIVLLGAILMTVAVAGGSLGVVNSGRAERSMTILSDRYLVLQPPVRALRAAVSGFQVVAERAFSDTGVDAALLAAAVQASTDTDRADITLQRLLSLPVNADLGPDLAPLYAAYVLSRTGLAPLLAAVAGPQTTSVAGTERAADQSLDTALASLQSTLSDRLVRTAGQARAAAADAQQWLLICIAVGLAFGISVTTMAARKALRAERAAAWSDRVQLRVTRRTEFEGRLARALEMATGEGAVFNLVAQALGEAAPGMRSELLFADSSRAHFRQVLVTPADTDEAGCGVVSPGDCPAVARGQTMVFPWSTAMDACPNLRGRACSALCAPVSIGGTSIGVVHVTTVDGTPPGDAVKSDVEVVVTRASERLAMLRAFSESRIEADSDSLTGLLTRRSLASHVRDLQDTGSSYSVAYGDLDHFKQLNDVFGHDAGDRALRTVAQVLRDALRPSDIPCRYGGEEFVIVLPRCPIPDATQVLDRIRQRLAERLTAGRIPTFTISFGLASSDQAVDFEQVVALADGALLEAKAGGRDRIVVVPRTGATTGATTGAETGAEATEIATLIGLPSRTVRRHG
jgi:diguanylate cyclase (GGDEF)-like protein